VGRNNRYGAALTALLLLGGTTACSSDSEPATRSNKIAIVVPSTLQDFGMDTMAGFAAGAKLVGGVEVLTTGTEIVDGPKQVSIFQDVEKTHTGGISVFTMTPDLFEEPLAAAGRAGIPIIAVDTPPAPSSNVFLLVANDNVELGRQLADTIATKLSADTTGTIVVGTRTPGAQVLDDRAAGLREQLAKKLPRVTVLGPFDTKQDVGANLAAWRLLVRANPHALAFLGTGDQDATHLARIRAETKGTWQGGGFTIAENALKAIKAGDLVVVSPEHYTEGVVAGRLQALRSKDGQALPKGWFYIPGVPVTADNVDQVIARQATDASRAQWSIAASDKILEDRATYLREMPTDG